MKILRHLTILSISLLVACSSMETQAPIIENFGISFNSELFGEAPAIIDAAEIYRLTDVQRAAFLEYFNDPSKQNIPTNERVYDYLQIITENFNYHGDTYTADVALSKSSGNCLSLAILTTALASLVDVDIGYELADATPVFERQGSVIYKGLHVRSILYDPTWQPEQRIHIFNRPGLRIDYFPSNTERFVSNLTKSEYIALYFSNIAAGAIARKDYSTAYWLLLESMEYAPKNAGTLNMMAVVHRRAGDDSKAEEIYKYGIEHLLDKVSFLRNYRILLSQQGRVEEAERISQALVRVDDPSPFDWLHAAQEAYNEGDFREAISFYKKAVEIAPYLHEGYLGLAKSKYRVGNKAGAELELKSALKYAYRESTRSLYQAKLMALANEY